MAKSKRAEPEVAAPTNPDDIFSRQRIIDFAPDDASIPAAEKVRRKGGFGKVEATADGKGWWVVCRGLTDTYQTSVRVEDGAELVGDCTCPSPKYPCKHVLALLLYLHDHPEERAEPEAPKHAATDFEALLRSVFQNPEDDTPRLVFADFLEENDQPDRAALIRAQCELARVKATSERGKGLKQEERALLAKLKPVVGTLPEGISATFRRGFLELSLNLFSLNDMGSLPERFTKLFRDGWVEVVRVLGYYYDVVEERHAALLGLVGELDFSGHFMREEGMIALVTHAAEMKATGRLCRLTVAKRDRKAFEALEAAQAGTATVSAAPGRVEQFRHYNGLTRQHLDLLIRAGRLRTARELALEGRLGYHGAEQLAAADLSNVESLRLIGWELNPDGLSLLADSPGLSGLTQFGLHQTSMEPEHMTALASGTNFRRIERLFLGDWPSDDTLRALAATTHFRLLKHLDLSGNRVTAKGVGDFLRSPNFPAIASITLNGRNVENSEALPLLLAAPERPELSLTFEGFTLSRRCTPAGVQVGINIPTQLREDVFARIPAGAGKGVVSLRAFRAEVTAKGLKALAKAFDPAKLRELDFRDMAVKNEGAEEFAAAFRDFKLETLRLQSCRVYASGVAALTASSVLDSVKVLDLSGNTIGKSATAALLNTSRLGSLEKLELSEGKVGTEDRKLLKAKFGKKLVF